MEIRINTDESGPDEFTALIALFASLGGRLPTVKTETLQLDVKVDTADAKATIEQLRANEQDETPYSTPAVAEAVGNSAVDSKGTPWDARIHSESRATVADGTWRKRRGVSDELFNEVMAELAASGNGADIAGGPSATDAEASPRASDDEAPPPPPADEGNAQASNEDVPAPPAPTAEEPSEPAPAASAPVAGSVASQFADFPAFVGAVSKHGKTYAELNEMAGTLGVPMFKDMKDHADKWDIFFSMIG